jgi:cation diffusion facilitator family transporter
MDRTHPQRVALLGIAVNAALAVVKLVAGVVGHSFALVADAVESLVDLAGSAVIWGGFVYGGRPPDKDHPFGHGRIEAMAGMAVAMLVIGAAVWIAVEAVRQIVTPHLSPEPFTLGVLVVVIVVKEGMHRVARRAARATGSSAGHADAWHHRSDAITSLFAFVGIAAALVGGPAWAVADDWAALAASGVILVNGVLIARLPFEELTDRHAPEVSVVAERVALAVDGVRAIEQCHARRSGRGYRIVLHAEVDPAMTVEASHRLTGIIKERVRESLPGVDSVLVHIEPYAGSGTGGAVGIGSTIDA